MCTLSRISDQSPMAQYWCCRPREDFTLDEGEIPYGPCAMKTTTAIAFSFFYFACVIAAVGMPITVVIESKDPNFDAALACRNIIIPIVATLLFVGIIVTIAGRYLRCSC